MGLVSAGFLLPDDVRSDYGFQTAIVPPNPGNGQNFIRRVPGEFFEIPITIICNLTTNATVANRTVLVRTLNGDDAAVDVAVAAFTQPANSIFSYRWTVSATGLFSVGGNFSVAPLNPTVLPSGWKLQIFVQTMQATDFLDKIAIIVQQYETGLIRVRTVTPRAIDTASLGVAPSGEFVAAPIQPAPMQTTPSVATTATPSPATPMPAPVAPSAPIHPAVTPAVREQVLAQTGYIAPTYVDKSQFLEPIPYVPPGGFTPQ